MKYRAALGLLVIGLASSSMGCDDGDDSRAWRGYKDSEIVFGISQSKNAEGKLSTSVGYEFLDVLDRGWSAVGLVSRDRSCWAERLDNRLGQPHVEGGVATFEGAALPDKGIAVIANRTEDLVLDAPAWQTGGDTLTFTARGFAMPDIGPAKLVAPSTDLALVAPADAAAEVIVDTAHPLEIGWTPEEAEATRSHESVVASLVASRDPAGRGVELRCFFDRRGGKGVFPQDLVSRFAALVGVGSEAIKGKLRIATHRQLTIHAEGGWTVYVVAAVDQREQPFVLRR